MQNPPHFLDGERVMMHDHVGSLDHQLRRDLVKMSTRERHHAVATFREQAKLGTQGVERAPVGFQANNRVKLHLAGPRTLREHL